mmetsp:Transcript_26866/g.65228  ORF Transcript_26866/g.65228 Transcript_26866/m.65228 type:complete len:220 (-) Transcript_26866:2278-2937(-)
MRLLRTPPKHCAISSSDLQLQTRFDATARVNAHPVDVALGREDQRLRPLPFARVAGALLEVVVRERRDVLPLDVQVRIPLQDRGELDLDRRLLLWEPGARERVGHADLEEAPVLGLQEDRRGVDGHRGGEGGGVGGRKGDPRGVDRAVRPRIVLETVAATRAEAGASGLSVAVVRTDGLVLVAEARVGCLVGDDRGLCEAESILAMGALETLRVFDEGR